MISDFRNLTRQDYLQDFRLFFLDEITFSLFDFFLEDVECISLDFGALGLMSELQIDLPEFGLAHKFGVCLDVSVDTSACIGLGRCKWSR